MQRAAARQSMIPSGVLTPQIAPSRVRSSEAEVCSTRTPARRQSRLSSSATSFALSDTGNTRFPRSVFNGRPRLSKKAMASAGEKRFTAL